VNRCTVCLTAHVPRCPGARALRWPAEPVFAAAGGSRRTVMALLHVSAEEVARVEREGLSDRQADQWAVRLGLHPSMLWPGYDRAGLTVADETFIWAGGWRNAWLHRERVA
jgi:hypothetical protein